MVESYIVNCFIVTKYRVRRQVILGPMLVAIGGRGPAANFCRWVLRLGGAARLVVPPDASPASRKPVDELRASGLDVCVATTRPDLCLAGTRLLHIQARSLFANHLPTRGEGGAERRVGTAGVASFVRDAIASVRKQKALVSIDLGEAEWIRTQGGSRAAYQLAAIRPDILFASGPAATELGAPLEGLAAVPLLTLGSQGCVVYGRRLAAPEGKSLDGDALVATFCVAFVEGAAPVEAAGRAVLVAANPLPPSGGRAG
jgi:sugar/nucleoside kinase (ribokinase family)